ncbi:DUF1573 domain-containing protein [Fontibacter flavus]|uniref:DUF1573 domain-containing protein n=1 Tax=Fontibacter flavus TaxID=654838 RepID=A0ABV6FSL1_9BACT
MNKSKYTVISVFLLLLLSLSIEAQTLDRKTLTWERKTINIGAVLEENGPVDVEFYAVNLHEEKIAITDIITDCGCTTVDFTKDSLENQKVASLKVKFDPDHRGGEFSKVIIVRTTEDIYGDTLYLEGINMPIPDNIEMAYPHRLGVLGFRLSSINMGNVLTNEPKIKYIEVHNFGQDTIHLNKDQEHLPDHLQVRLEPEYLNPGERGLMIFTYDGTLKGDLGYLEESVAIKLESSEEKISLKLIAVVFEYFEPVPKSMENLVPRLGFSESDIDLKDISSSRKVERSVTLINMGQEPLEIRKVVSNCPCLTIELDERRIEAGQRIQLKFEFDPKGRRGIDHKHITLFTNDPINPVRTIIIKSTIK